MANEGARPSASQVFGPANVSLGEGHLGGGLAEGGTDDVGEVNTAEPQSPPPPRTIPKNGSTVSAWFVRPLD
jgi:hypothetical protein